MDKLFLNIMSVRNDGLTREALKMIARTRMFVHLWKI